MKHPVSAVRPLLEISGLEVRLAQRRRTPKLIIRDVSLTVASGESVGLVGESGSGKSMTTRAILRLLPAGAEVHGSINFDGVPLMAMSKSDLRTFRARRVAKIYQDPRAHINPVHSVGDFLVEGVVSSGQLDSGDAWERAVGLLGDVGIRDADRRMRQYPHELSGGLLQRVMIVAALMSEPDLILADEPTTALDATVQSEVMAILEEQRSQRGLAMLFITHDLDLAAAVTQRMVVMYAGSVVEMGPSAELCSGPGHPYTAALLGSRPSASAVRTLVTIPGRPISASEAGDGCVFASRCQFAQLVCHKVRPGLQMRGERSVACHFAEELSCRLPAGQVS